MVGVHEGGEARVDGGGFVGVEGGGEGGGFLEGEGFVAEDGEGSFSHIENPKCPSPTQRLSSR